MQFMEVTHQKKKKDKPNMSNFQTEKYKDWNGAWNLTDTRNISDIGIQRTMHNKVVML